MENIIQLLKKNRYPFGIWPDPECYGKELGEAMQEKAREIGAKSEHFGCLATDKEEECWAGGIRGRFVFGLTYCLRADYEDEPEIEECEITHEISKTCGRLGVVKPNRNRVPLSEVCNHPDFIGFKFEDGKIRSVSTVYGKPNITTTQFYEIDESDLGDCEVLHATHVLFRQKPKE